jgi:hypothetical protein
LAASRLRRNHRRRFPPSPSSCPSHHCAPSWKWTDIRWSEIFKLLSEFRRIPTNFELFQRYNDWYRAENLLNPDAVLLCALGQGVRISCKMSLTGTFMNKKSFCHGGDTVSSNRVNWLLWIAQKKVW